MENFDFTQFITFNTNLSYAESYEIINELFSKIGFKVVSYDKVDDIKKEYYMEHWKNYSFELEKDDFLSDFMDWKEFRNVPNSIIEFKSNIDILRKYSVKEIGIFICSIAEKTKTTNEISCILYEELIDELYKMSIYSYNCPQNLIIHILD